jgi:hypothetical protein
MTIDLGAHPIREPVAGAPFQPGDRVRVVDAVDRDIYNVAEFVRKRGQVVYLEYCDCGQTYPGDPMIGVMLDVGVEMEFWPEELTPEKSDRSP